MGKITEYLNASILSLTADGPVVALVTAKWQQAQTVQMRPRDKTPG